MDLKQHYTALYNESIEKIVTNTYQIDNQIDSLSDRRFGITLLIRPDSQTKKNIQDFLDELKQIDPDQYYYPSSDIHITVLSIISCYDGFDLATILIPDYIAIIEKSLVGIQDIAINFQGVTASPSAIMLQGFTNSNSLDDLRNNLRTNFTNSGLQESIDKRYSINTAHATVARFRKEISHTEKLIAILEKYRNFDFGKFKVEKYHLVYNDWYQREQFVKELHEFQSS
ncbi:2'-5' RNA ligase family protein [Flavobacterium sp. 120]|uniref:2'-5' RNA ligase family protein n=1 Tax=Flavobacterium sp. 120 TaxID=2135626 RepID=UPI000EABB4FF|nr:mutarotase [Flavobacterium sp. 120]RKS14631.1 A-kinase anchor protein AKAP7 [Flavobacterium sp. 120]